MTLVDLFTILGAAVVLPWAVLSVSRVAWIGAAAAAAVALQMPEGTGAAVVACPWLVVAAAAATRRALVLRGEGSWSIDALVQLAAPAFAAVAGAALIQSCLGQPALGIHEPIIQLTAVHFTFAGAGGAALAGFAHRRAEHEWRVVTTAAVLLTVGAPPVVAIGFVTDAVVPRVGGAVLMTLGVWCTAIAQLNRLTDQPARVRRMLAASSVAVFAAMPLAVAWAAAQHWGAVPALSIPDMVRTHGMLNGMVFIPLGLHAWRVAERTT